MTNADHINELEKEQFLRKLRRDAWANCLDSVADLIRLYKSPALQTYFPCHQPVISSLPPTNSRFFFRWYADRDAPRLFTGFSDWYRSGHSCTFFFQAATYCKLIKALQVSQSLLLFSIWGAHTVSQVCGVASPWLSSCFFRIQSIIQGMGILGLVLALAQESMRAYIAWHAQKNQAAYNQYTSRSKHTANNARNSSQIDYPEHAILLWDVADAPHLTDATLVNIDKIQEYIQKNLHSKEVCIALHRRGQLLGMGYGRGIFSADGCQKVVPESFVFFENVDYSLPCALQEQLRHSQSQKQCVSGTSVNPAYSEAASNEIRAFFYRINPAFSPLKTAVNVHLVRAVSFSLQLLLFAVAWSAGFATPFFFAFFANAGSWLLDAVTSQEWLLALCKDTWLFCTHRTAPEGYWKNWLAIHQEPRIIGVAHDTQFSHRKLVSNALLMLRVALAVCLTATYAMGGVGALHVAFVVASMAVAGLLAVYEGVKPSLPVRFCSHRPG